MAKTYTAIQTRLVLPLTGAGGLKQLLGIPDDNTAYDARLTLALSAGKKAADDFCQNDFLADDGVTLAAIPDTVKLGVVLWVKRHLLLREPGVKWDQARDLAKSYAADASAIEREIQGYWWSERMAFNW